MQMGNSKPERPYNVFKKEWIKKNKNIHSRDKNGQWTPQFHDELNKAWDLAKVKPRFQKLARIQQEYKDAVNANVPRRQVAFSSNLNPTRVQIAAMLSDAQLDAVRRMGLLPIISNTCSQIHRSFIYDLCQSFNANRRVLKVHGDEHVISLSDVSRLLGIPCVGSPVPRDFNCAEEEKCVMSRYHGLLSVDDLFALIRQHKGDAGVLFQQDFLALVFGSFLFPTTMKVLSRSLFHMICCAENFVSYNWAEAVLNFMCDEILTFKKKRTNKIGGCVHLLLLFYLEHYFPDSASIAEGEIPLLFWTDWRLKEYIEKHEKTKTLKKSCVRNIKQGTKRRRCNRVQTSSSLDEVNVGVDEESDGPDHDSSAEGNNVNINMDIDSMSDTEAQAASALLEFTRGSEVQNLSNSDLINVQVEKSKPMSPFDVFKEEWMTKNTIYLRDNKKGQRTLQFNKEMKKAWDVAKVEPRFQKLAQIDQQEDTDATNANVPS